MSDHLPRPALVVSTEPLTAHERLLVIEADDGPLDLAPGRFVQVTVPGVGECPISLCSDAGGRPAPRLELCVRRAGLVTTALHRLAPGDRVGLRGPYGRGFPLDRVLGRDLLVVAGGLGMAPLRSLIHRVLARRPDFGDVTLIYGTRSPADLLFRDEVTDWLHGGEIRVVLTVDAAPAGDWLGGVGPVTAPLRRFAFDAARTAAFVVGPPVMFRYVLEELRAKGLADNWIFCSLERRMACAIGKCGQCQVEDLLVCRDGPVFSVADLAGREEAL